MGWESNALLRDIRVNKEDGWEGDEEPREIDNLGKQSHDSLHQ